MMKKILLLLCATSIIACKEEPKNYVTLSGQITKSNSDSLYIYQGRNFSKTIKVNPDGSFSDTLKVTEGNYGLYDGNEESSLYLKNGYDLKISLDAKKFRETISYTGIGAKSNNFLAKKALFEENLYPENLYSLNETEFVNKIHKIKEELSTFLNKNNDIDTGLLAKQKEELDKFSDDMLKDYKRYVAYKKERVSQFAHLIGKPSPNFSNYINIKGGTTSLSDLKGKYVYVDLWATWCGPCKREIPYLKEVETKFHDKNIEFVSISVDNGRGYSGNTPEEKAEKAKEGWKKMVVEKELGGVQLYADKAWNSDFVTGYNVRGIPRFILIDPAGNVVNADAPRPSDPALVNLFNKLNI